jgi:hypothetical protein
VNALDRYIRHGRRFGVDTEFWRAAGRDLAAAELRRLAGELGVTPPATEPAKPTDCRECGNRLGDRNVTGLCARCYRRQTAAQWHARARLLPTDAVSRSGHCVDCGRALPMRNRSGYCRTCYQRRLMRARRATRAEDR